MGKEVAALIVTYNRLNLLKESINSVLGQSKEVNHLIIVDNHSTDGTKEFLEGISNDKLIYLRLNNNIGGAGGFFEGTRYFCDYLDDDYLWMMDDDTIPNEDSLSELYDVTKKFPSFGFLASNVRWTDGSAAVMNVPSVDPSEWNSSINKNSGKFYPVLKHASFVSLLISSEAVIDVGLPIKEFFIWGDDVEFTERISRKYNCFFVPHSIVIHKTKSNNGVDIVSENGKKVNRYFYDVRNRIYRARKAPGKSGLELYIRVFRDFYRVLFKKNVDMRIKKTNIMIRGLFKGMFFNPEIMYVDKSRRR